MNPFTLYDTFEGDHGVSFERWIRNYDVTIHATTRAGNPIQGSNENENQHYVGSKTQGIEGKPHGFGILTYKDLSKSMKQGWWKNGVFEDGTISDFNGEI